ncbi:MAG: cation diffusion facilitator family transporter [Trueperaceae bacterium]
MSANHSHRHGLDQRDGAAGRGRRHRGRLTWVLALVLLYMVAEVIGGLLANSLALLADAGHMLSDAGALTLSLFAIWVSRKPPTSEHTYGYYRTEILAALVNGATLVAISGYIFYEAFRRIGDPPAVQGGLMLSVALGGLLINVAGLLILNGGRNDNLNVRGAWLHVLTDTLGSLGAIAAGALIWAFGWHWADPSVSVLIALLVLYSAWGLLKETVNVLLEGAPGHIDVDAVRARILGCSGVDAVHDLHVWTITSGMPALSAHVVVRNEHFRQETLRRVRVCLQDNFGIDHVTIQLEREDLEEPSTAV